MITPNIKDNVIIIQMITPNIKDDVIFQPDLHTKWQGEPFHSAG
jgi:hypothetical protein